MVSTIFDISTPNPNENIGPIVKIKGTGNDEFFFIPVRRKDTEDVNIRIIKNEYIDSSIKVGGNQIYQLSSSPEGGDYLAARQVKLGGPD